MKNRRVLVTGANGHVGNTLVKALCEAGYEVRATVRNLERVKAEAIFDGCDVELHEADIRDEQALGKAMQGVSGVFQVAALYNFNERVNGHGPGNGIIANNTEGSLTVLRLARTRSVDRVVMTSSIVAVGFGGTAERPMTEQDWSNPRDPYCRSKLESEQAAWEFSQTYGLDLVTICPGVVLGPNFYRHTPSTKNVGAFVNNRAFMRFPHQTSVVDVRDVALAHIMAYENPKASGRYLVSGTHIPDLWEKLQQLDRGIVLPERFMSIDEMKQFAEKTGASTEMIGQSFRYSDNRIRSELGWRNRPVEETLATTIRWIRERGM